MHFHYLDPYHEGKSVIHALDARVKFVLALAFILTVSLMPIGAAAMYVILFALAMAIVVLSELGIGYVLKRAGLAVPFALAALPLVFTAGAPLLAQAPLGFLTIEISQAGLARFLSVLAKSYISMLIGIVLATTTPFPMLLTAMRAVRLPRMLVAIFGLMWRYLFVLADEANRLLRARAARSGAPAEKTAAGGRLGGSIPWRARVAGGMAGNLFLRSFERGDRIYAAMSARGYDGEVRGFAAPALNPAQQVMLGMGLASCIGLVVLSRLLG